MPSVRGYIVIRLSALGDVAMTLPFLYQAARCLPNLPFVFVTQPFPSQLLINKPDNVRVITFDKKQISLLSFAWRLHRSCPGYHIIDLHSVLRSIVIDTLLFALGHSVTRLRKPRKKRRQFLKQRASHLDGLPPMTQLYAETFSRAGIKAVKEGELIASYPKKKAIGIAFFAQHKGKILDPLQQEQLLALISSSFPEYTIILYGGGGDERKRNEELALLASNIETSHSTSFSEELNEIGTLSCMVSMDSANQHIAANLGVPVLSLWIQTHPKGGFTPFRIPEENCIGTSLDCRPCSFFGNKECTWGHWRCRTDFPIESVVTALRRILKKE